VFALGALLDLSLPARNAEAEGYHQLGMCDIILLLFILISFVSILPLFCSSARAAVYLRTIYTTPEVCAFPIYFFFQKVLTYTAYIQIATVQALSFFASYHHVAANGVTYTIDSAWRLHTFACKIGESMGLREFFFQPPSSAHQSICGFYC
jgi:hypothetical protein